MATKYSAVRFDLDTATVDDIWRKELDISNRLDDGSIHFAMAKEQTNAMGKALKVVQVKLEYSKLRKEPPDIPQLGGGGKPSK